MLSSRRWLVLIGALAASGCNCGKRGGSSTGGLVGESGIPEMPATLNFGNVALGQTARLQLQLQNTGTGILDVLNQAVSGPPFAESTPFATTTSVAPGGKTHAIIAFTPTQAGPVSGTFTLGSDGNPSTATVALVGVGLDIDVSATPTSLSFGQVPVGIQPAPTQTVTLENSTTAPLYVTLSTTGTASEYTITDAQGMAPPTTQIELAPNTPYVLTVAFEPDSVSIFNSAFTFTPCATMGTSACIAAQTISLSGQGVSGQVAFSPNPISFNAVPDGTSANQTITVTNTGNASATVSCLYLQSLGASACGTASSSFTLGTPSQTLPATLTAGQSFTFTLTYVSAGVATVTDVLEATYTAQGVTTPATATDNIAASQTAAPCAISLSPTSLNFTYATAGTPVSATLTVNNSGGMDCQLTAIAIDPSSDPGYTLASGQSLTEPVPAGGSATIGVSFELAANSPPNTRLGHLDFQSTDPANPNVAVPLIASLVSPYAGGGAWPRWHHDNIQSGLSPNDTSHLAGTVAWTVLVSVPTNNIFTLSQTDYMNSPVVGSDGTIYQLGMDGTLYAINPDGGIQWSTALEGPVVDPHPGTPIIDSDGSLFVAFGDTIQAGEEYGTPFSYGLYHVSSTGTIIAQIPPVGDGDGFDLPPVLTNGGLLLGGDDESGSNGETGAFAFQIGTAGTFNLVDQSNLPSVYDQESAVVGPDDTTYWCVGSTCEALSPPASGFKKVSGWPIKLNGGQAATSDLALDEFVTGNLMVLSGGWETNYQTFDGLAETNVPQQLFSVVPSTGAVAWTVNLPVASAAQQNSGYGGVGDATVGNSCPAIATDGTVYVGNFDGLHAIVGATGAEKSGFPFATSSVVLTAPAIGGDDTIFFGTADGTFYAVNPDGSQRFTVHAGGRIAGSPAIGPDGTVYFTANDGYLYAVQ